MDGGLGYVWILPKVTTRMTPFLTGDAWIPKPAPRWGGIQHIPKSSHGTGILIYLPTFTKPWKLYHSCIPYMNAMGMPYKDSIVAVIFSDSGCLSPPSMQKVMHHRKLPTKQWAVSRFTSFPFPRREDLEIGWPYPSREESWDLKTGGLEIPEPCYTSQPLYSRVQWFLRLLPINQPNRSQTVKVCVNFCCCTFLGNAEVPTAPVIQYHEVGSVLFSGFGIQAGMITSRNNTSMKICRDSLTMRHYYCTSAKHGWEETNANSATLIMIGYKCKHCVI